MTTFNKLDGFYGFTADFTIRLVWNSDPFVQGLYMLAYSPPGAYPPQGLGDPQVVADAMYFSGCPRVIFNINSQVHAQLTVPYVGPDTFIKTGHDYQPLLGDFYVVPICEAEGPSCFNKLDYNVYFRLENLRTYGVYPGEFDIEGNYDSFAIAQSLSESLQKANNVLATGSSVASFIDNFVPGTNSMYEKAEWLTGGASKIADLLGWSKPFNYNSLSSVQVASYIDTTTADSNFNGAKMAVNIDAGISKLDLSGRKMDDLLISNVLSRPNLIPFEISGTVSKKHNWSSSDDVGTQLYYFDIQPSKFAVSTSHGTINTHLSYVSHLFKVWRGSIKLMFKFASTAFQTGRLRLVFVPEADAVPPNMNMLPYCYAHIIDLREPSTWEVEIPYLRERPWLTTTEKTGKLIVLVETPLKAACSVLQSINYAIFASAGKDLEFAIPLIPSVHPIPNVTTRPARIESQSGYTNEQLSMLQARGHQQYEMEAPLPVELIPSSSIGSKTAHRVAIGDPVRSLRTLLKKFTRAHNGAWNTSTHPTVDHYLLPRVEVTERISDYITYISPLFAFWRGGMRIYANNYGIAEVGLFLGDSPPTGYSNATNGSDATNFDESISHFYAGVSEPTKLEIPYYYTSRCMNTFKPAAQQFPYVRIHYHVTGLTSNYFARATADDFDMGYLVGAPLTN